MTPTTEIAKQTKAEIQALSSPLLIRLQSLEIDDAESYRVADGMLVRVRDVRKAIMEKMSTILDPAKEAVDAAKRAYAASKAFSDELDAPLAQGEAQLRIQMKDYKNEERNKALEAEREAREKADKLQREADEKRRREQAAPTAKLREKLAQQRAELEDKADRAVASVPTVAKNQGSGTRVTRKYRVTDFEALVKAAMDPKSDVPMDVLAINKPLLDQYFRQAASAVEKWPGIEGYDDVTIVAR